MKRDLPPFHAVRAFEAAARHLSFKAAAEELNVTQSAVSHQVKALETYLNVGLFVRRARAVSLTKAGRTYLPGLRDALDRISGATERVRAADLSGPLTVSATSAFATKWLIPRLGGFRTAHPDLDVRINIDPPSVDFDQGDTDIAIRFGHETDWPGLYAERLMRSILFAVCSPKLLTGAHPLRRPTDLRHHTLLHYDYGEDWGRWLEAAGVGAVDSSRGIHFNDCNLYFESAIQGQGVALGYGSLLTAELADGRLVRPFEVELMPVAWYHIICPETMLGRPRIAAFRNWLLAETAHGEDTIPADRQTGAAGGRISIHA